MFAAVGNPATKVLTKHDDFHAASHHAADRIPAVTVLVLKGESCTQSSLQRGLYFG